MELIEQGVYVLGIQFNAMIAVICLIFSQAKMEGMKKLQYFFWNCLIITDRNEVSYSLSDSK